MSGREPLLGVLTVLGLGLMLVADGALDVLGLLLATAPIGYGVACWLRARAR